MVNTKFGAWPPSQKAKNPVIISEHVHLYPSLCKWRYLFCCILQLEMWTSPRYGGKAPFEHHFDLHIAQDFFYDKKSGRKLQFIVDLINFSNMLNRNWGIYNTGSYNLQILGVSQLTKDSNGNMTPTYKFDPQDLEPHDFNSRWRCQLGFRLVF